MKPYNIYALLLIFFYGCYPLAKTDPSQLKGGKADVKSNDSPQDDLDLSRQSRGDSRDCTIEEFDGFIRECCAAENPYSGLRNCTNFAAHLHGLCKENGKNCRTVSLGCKDPESNHRVNIVEIRDRGHCLIEPQSGRIHGCSQDPDEVSKEAICSAMNRPEGCNCRVKFNSPDIVHPNTRVFSCRQKNSKYGECIGCCGDHWWYKECKKQQNTPGCHDWYKRCLNECTGLPHQ